MIKTNRHTRKDAKMLVVTGFLQIGGELSAETINAVLAADAVE